MWIKFWKKINRHVQKRVKLVSFLIKNPTPEQL